jgi:hypothetical protein
MNAEDLPAARSIEPCTVAGPPGQGGCPWCPRGSPQRSTHVGLCDGSVLVYGCHWHMRLWRQRGELRAIQTPPPPTRRRR